jgi:ribose-phosphate pyrophosphokinase
VVIQLPDRDWRGQAVVILDDVASTGHTVAQAARRLLEAGAATVDVAVTHALFAGDALQVLRDAGIGQVWSTDCIAHETNVIQMAPALADAVRGILLKG